MPRDFESFSALFETMGADIERVLHERSESVLRSAGEHVKEHAQAQLGHYLDHGGPYPGEPWKPLAASTLAKKAHDTPLVETGAMHDAIEVHATPTEVEIGVRSEVGSRGVDVGDIAVWQEFGTGHIPPRPFLGPALFENQKEIAEDIAAGIFVELTRR